MMPVRYTEEIASVSMYAVHDLSNPIVKKYLPLSFLEM
jgi:hypothetical protein